MRDGDRGDAAQMMLLTAFILLIGFVALAGMVARVSQLADETSQESRRGTVLEVATFLDGGQEVLALLEDRVPPGDTDATTDYLAAVDGAMLHFDALQSARGFRFQAEAATCTQTGSDADIAVQVTLARADLRTTATLSHRITDATCP